MAPVGNKKMIIGLTGGVGSGKSTVLKLLKERYGAEVLEADRVAEELMLPGGSCYPALIELLGKDITDETGCIRRPELAARLFREPGLKEQVNALVHPATFAEVKRRLEASKSPLLVYEAALPAEARFRELCSLVLYVWADPFVRRERLLAGRGYSFERSAAIMENQLSEEEFAELSDVILDNSGSEAATARRLLKLMRKIMKAWKRG